MLHWWLSSQHRSLQLKQLWCLPCLLSGDDPNYWVKLTQQADAEYVAKKVRKMLADINQPGSKQVCWAGGGGRG